MDKFWTFLTEVFTRLIDKMNVFMLLVIVFLFGIVERADIEWLFDKLGAMTTNILP